MGGTVHIDNTKLTASNDLIAVLHKKCSNIYNYDEDKEFIKKDARIRFSKR